MSEEQKRIEQLTYALGLAIGALETVRLCPYDFNQDGVKNVHERLRAIAELPFIIILPEAHP